MALPTPIIDRRDQKALAEKLRELIVTYASEWPDVAAVEADGQVDALVQIFARFYEVINERLNGVPDRNFLTFLEMAGVDIDPPRAAATPLVFQAAENVTADVTVPVGTQIIVEGSEDDPIIFETRELLTTITARLNRIVSLEPTADRYTDHVSLLDPDARDVETLLTGKTPLTHRLFFGHDVLFDYKDAATVRVHTSIKTPVSFPSNQWNVDWFIYTQESDDPVKLTPVIDDVVVDTDVKNLLRGGTITFENVEGISNEEIGGYVFKESAALTWNTLTSDKRWLVAELTSSLPAQTYSKLEDQEAEEAYFNATEYDPAGSFRPFGVDPTLGDRLNVAHVDVLDQPGATITLDFDLSQVGTTTDINIEWQYLEGSLWKKIGFTGFGGVTDAGDYRLEDDTNGFKQSGQVRFICPTFSPALANSITNRWIRAIIRGGEYANGAEPVVSAMTIGYTYVPELLTLQVETELSPEAPQQADHAYLNGQILDTGRDFYPFGETPAFNDTFYFALEAAFANEGANITIDAVLSESRPAPSTLGREITLALEYFDGYDWSEIARLAEDGVDSPMSGVTDETYAFTVLDTDTQISFTCPDVRKVTINGIEDYWLRFRIVDGDYGQPASYDGGTETYTNATYVPPSLEKFRIDYSFTTTEDPEQLIFENEFFFADETAALIANNATPASASPITFFRTSGDLSPALYLSFDRDIQSLPINLFFPILASPFQVTNDSEPPTMLWEYWDGSEWQVTSFNDGTVGLTRGEIAQVLVPGDSKARPIFGNAANWIRVRLEAGTFVTNPEVDRLYANAVWSDNVVTIRDELLGSSNAEPDQRFNLARFPVLQGQQILVREAAITKEDRAEIIAEEGEDAITEITDEAGNVTDIWVRWHQVTRFEGSGPQSRHYIFDALKGEILFGNGVRGYLPPAGRDNIRAGFYQYGGGTAGNVEAFEIVRPRSALVGIEEVFNPSNVSGGVDLESLERLRERGPRTIKNRGRAITPDDFEALAFEATGEIARVRCLATTDPSLMFAPGWVTILIVPISTDLKPVPSQELIRATTDYVRSRSLSHLIDDSPVRVNVLGPGYVNVYAELDVAYKNINEARLVQDRINKALNTFLHPLTGGDAGTGWPFGRNVYATEIYELVESVAGVDYVAQAVLRAAEHIFYVYPVNAFTPSAPYPAGSLLRITRGAFQADLRTGELLREDESISRVTVLGFKEGDVVTLYDTGMQNPLNLEVTGISGVNMSVRAAFANVSYGVGSTVCSADKRVQISVTEAVSVGEFTNLVLMIPQAEDAFELQAQDLATIRGEFSDVSDEVEVVILGPNNLTYPGTHVIRALQEGS